MEMVGQLCVEINIPVLSLDGVGVLGVEAIRRINEGHSFDEPSQHLGRLRMAAQQIGREHGGRARQASSHDTWLAAGSDMRLARQSQGQTSGNQSHHHVEGRHALRDQRLLIELA